ncbi:hypothetical protein JCM14469_25530 [Desulfatiferula olefinivorans]
MLQNPYRLFHSRSVCPEPFNKVKNSKTAYCIMEGKNRQDMNNIIDVYRYVQGREITVEKKGGHDGRPKPKEKSNTQRE